MFSTHSYDMFNISGINVVVTVIVKQDVTEQTRNLPIGGLFRMC